MQGFITFIRQQGVVGLAIGFILGGAVSEVVNSLVNDIVTPLLGIFLGAATPLTESYIQIGAIKIMTGSFLATLIDFVIIAAVVYYIVKSLGLDKIDKSKE